ncbi:heavy metal translocatin [Calocera viscosa TUFC12733]|uniref:Heavy metal translocatin n=1 Tax=Calocera viscosa (strain TUFC12733) TaxID=1330018 RepID=A0A167FL66_CALVF|nr:heavy metal translocatin [Calocera viscosa TUFC12733]
MADKLSALTGQPQGAESLPQEEVPAMQVTVEKSEPRVVITQLSISGMTCSSCTSAITSALMALPGVASVDVSLISHSAAVSHDENSISAKKLADEVEDIGFDAQVVSSKPLHADEEEKEKRMRSYFAIEGMTCSSCTSTLTQQLSPLPSVTDLDISLRTNSASLTHDSSLLPIQKVLEAIEDCGFDATFVRSEPLAGDDGETGGKKAKGKGKARREVTLRIEGAKDGDARAGVLSALSALGVKVLSPPSSAPDLFTLSYAPTPELTIRTIFASLPPPLSGTLYRPPTLSELARKSQLKELHHRLLAFSLSFLFAIPTFVIGIVGMLLLPSSNRLNIWCMAPAWGGATAGTLFLFALATPVYFVLAARTFHYHAYQALRAAVRRHPFRLWHLISFGNMDTLVSLSITVAYWSSIGMMARDISLGSGNGTGATYFDSVVFLVFFILMGRSLEARARVMTGDAIALLGTLRPETADLVAFEPSIPIDEAGEKLPPSVEDGTQTQSLRTQAIPMSHLELGDRILLRPGSLPPADGILVSGSTTFDESSLTGESVPVPKLPGDEIWTGTTNLSSACVVEVVALGEGTMLERIVRAVGDAQGRKAPVELLADRITAVFVPVIIWLSLVVLVIWLGCALTNAVPESYLSASDLGGGAGATVNTKANRVFFSFEFMIAVLVVACPCGIGLAAPTAQAVGAGLAAKMGVLAQGGGEAFQLATQVDTVVFDKTGTITVGETKVEDAHFLDGEEKGWVREAVRVIEEGSSHPLGAALRTFCEFGEGGVEVLHSEEVAGRGAKGTVNVRGSKYEVVIGNEAFMGESEAQWPAGKDKRAEIQLWKTEAKSVVLVASRSVPEIGSPKEFTMAALFSISDSPRPDSADAIATLRKLGKDVWMLSGDNEITARAVAKRVGIDEDHVIAGVLPQEKADHIRGLQAGGQRGARTTGWTTTLLHKLGLDKGQKHDDKAVVLFCGDGLNDSAAIAAADVGVALGHGSQITVAAADFIILSSSLSTLPSLLHLATRVYRRQKQNFGWALIYNCAALPLAAGVFYAAGHVRLPPVWSALAMALSSVSVVMSSLALRWGL